jgi:hypothetical protein
MTHLRPLSVPEKPVGSGPLSDAEPETGRPIDDPTLADRANPRWEDPASPRPDAQPLANPDGSPNVLPSSQPPRGADRGLGQGTLQDQAARVMHPEVGPDNIREGRGGGAPNPALAEGGESG